MKKILSVLLMLVLIITAAPLSLFDFRVSAETVTSGITGDCIWTLDGTILTISGNGEMENYTTSAPNPWGQTLTKVIVDNGVTSIGDYAFGHCENLTSITIPNSVTSIGSYAFYDCSSLTSITIPDSVISIGYRAFISCSKLTSITIPDSVTSIGERAFEYCSKLTSITIPDSVTSIGDYAFYDCSSLKEVHITDIAAWCNIDFNEYYSNPLYYAKNLYLNGELVTDLVIPNGVTSIGSFAFYECYSLTSITIPDSVTSIGDYAFRNCIALANVYYNGSKASKNEIVVGSYNNRLLMAVWHCLDGDYIVNHGITSTGYTGYCTWTLDGTILTISGNGATDDYCTWYEWEEMQGVWMKEVDEVLPTPWGTLISDIVIEGNVSVGAYAFNGCEINTITLKNENIRFSSWGVGGSIYEVIIPDGIKSIESSLIPFNTFKKITIPNSVTSIGEYAFSSCSSLTSVTIPDSVTSIGDGAFADCTSLKDVWYYGSEIDKSNITIGSNNSYLTDATWHYLCKEQHEYDSACDGACNNCEYERMPPHNFDNACDVSCNDCGIIRVTNHFYTNECDRDCNGCGEFRKSLHKFDNACDDTCNLCGTEREVDDHVYSNGCDTDCNECGAIRTVPDHIYTNACDCDCNICGFVRIPSNHIYDNACDTTCNECGSIREVGEHVYDGACDIYCNICGDGRDAPEQHTYTNACDSECNICGFVHVPSDHVYGNPCDIDCNVCGFIRTVEHTFTNECDTECDICYETRKAPHKYDSICDAECNLCGKTRTVPDHQYGDNKVCDICGHKNFVLGDIDGTGVADLSDVSILAKYFAGWNVEVNEDALDCNGDGKVNLNDLVLLAQFVAGWEVELH